MMNNNGQLPPLLNTPGERSEINRYTKRFQGLYNDYRTDNEYDPMEFARMLNVEVSSMLAVKPDHKHLIKEAIRQFKRIMRELQAESNKRRGK